jgi:hypothetical protein
MTGPWARQQWGIGEIWTEIDRSPNRINRTASASAASSERTVFKALDSE